MTVQNLKKNFRDLRSGFTLIELLIVIAILGVLAVVVLVAINPVQQLARTRDAGRISTVAQLGHASEAYYTAQGAVYPQTLAALASTGELNQVPGMVDNSLTTECTGHTDGWCVDVDADPATEIAIWSALEAQTNISLCGVSATAAYAAYLSSAGRTCIVCDEPTSATTDTDCVN
ncbi:type II secretion system protein [Candidatus Woesebacteria bacterium]|nr:MAG: type II secretion system protein [Candidatus Woesebacteria bacterium]